MVDSVEIRERCLKEEITIADIRREAKAIKEMKEVQLALMDGLGELCWDDVLKGIILSNYI